MFGDYHEGIAVTLKARTFIIHRHLGRGTGSGVYINYFRHSEHHGPAQLVGVVSTRQH